MLRALARCASVSVGRDVAMTLDRKSVSMFCLVGLVASVQLAQGCGDVDAYRKPVTDSSLAVGGGGSTIVTAMVPNGGTSLVGSAEVPTNGGAPLWDNIGLPMTGDALGSNPVYDPAQGGASVSSSVHLPASADGGVGSLTSSWAIPTVGGAGAQVETSSTDHGGAPTAGCDSDRAGAFGSCGGAAGTAGAAGAAGASGSGGYAGFDCGPDDTPRQPSTITMGQTILQLIGETCFGSSCCEAFCAQSARTALYLDDQGAQVPCTSSHCVTNCFPTHRWIEVGMSCKRARCLLEQPWRCVEQKDGAYYASSPEGCIY